MLTLYRREISSAWCQQATLLYPAFLLLCEFVEHLAQMTAQIPVQQLLAALRDEYHMVFALPFRMT